MSFKVRTQTYSGPFDLLLQLVGRQRVDIGAISVADVTDQYLFELGDKDDLDLDVASDFMLVAATLLDLKAAALVPAQTKNWRRSDDDEDALDNLPPEIAREVLIARLIEYKKFRSAACELAAREEAEARMVPRTAGPDPIFLDLVPDYLEGTSLQRLAKICAEIDSRHQAFLLEAEHVAPRRRPLALRVAEVDRLVRARGHMNFSELTAGEPGIQNIVATFLAILELAGRGSLTISQRESFGEIEVDAVVGAAAFDLTEAELSSSEEMT